MKQLPMANQVGQERGLETSPNEGFFINDNLQINRLMDRLTDMNTSHDNLINDDVFWGVWIMETFELYF